MSTPRAIADAAPLIALSWIDQLNLLDELFSEVLVPFAVRHEVLRAAPDIAGIDALGAAFAAGRLQEITIQDRERVRALTPPLGLGESEAIVLAQDHPDAVLLLDDRPARTMAVRLGLNVLGVIGLLRRARDSGLVANVYPMLLDLRAMGYRLSDRLLDQVRRDEAHNDQG